MASTSAPRGTGTIYLLHFARPISPHHTARHYCGWTDDLAARLAAHAAGRGARLTQVAVERGIAWDVARTWPGDRALERRLKRRKSAPYLCPLCGAGDAENERGGGGQR